MDELFKRYFPDSYEKWLPNSRRYLPLKLFEFLIQNDVYLSFRLDVLLTIFGSKLENVLLEIRRVDDFDSFLDKIPFKILKLDIISAINKISPNKHYWDLTINRRIEIIEFDLPEALKYRESDKNRYIKTFFKHSEPEIILYDNLLLINENGETELENLFHEIKGWLS